MTPPINVIKEYLEKKGFKVVLDGSLEGISGIEHHFSILAFKGKKIVCVDIPNPSFFLPSVYGKAIDIPWARILVPVKGDNLCNYDHTACNLSIISYRNVEELIDKIKELL